MILYSLKLNHPSESHVFEHLIPSKQHCLGGRLYKLWLRGLTGRCGWTWVCRVDLWGWQPSPPSHPILCFLLWGHSFSLDGEAAAAARPGWPSHLSSCLPQVFCLSDGLAHAFRYCVFWCCFGWIYALLDCCIIGLSFFFFLVCIVHIVQLPP